MQAIRIVFTFSFFLVLTVQRPLKADVATEGEINRMIRIENLKDFPEWEFFIRYATYHYDHGYQEGEPIEIILSPDSNFVTGSRYSSSLLYARKKGDVGYTFVSDNEVGGSVIERNPSVQAYVDVIRILKLEDGKLLFKVQRTDKLQRNKKGELVPYGKRKGWDMLYPILLPLISLAGLLFFFLYRRKQGNLMRGVAA